MTHQRKVGVSLHKARLEALEHVGEEKPAESQCHRSALRRHNPLWEVSPIHCERCVHVRSFHSLRTKSCLSTETYLELAIVVKLRKGSDASFLVQVGKVRTYECHNFHVGVVWTLPLIVFFSLPCPLALEAQGCPLAVTYGGVCSSSASEARRILLTGLPRLSLGLLWLMEIVVLQNRRTSPWTWQALDPSLFLFQYPVWKQIQMFQMQVNCIRNIWIWEGSLEAALWHAGCLCKGQTQSLQFVHSCCGTVQSLRAGEWLLCQEVWRIHPLIIEIGELSWAFGPWRRWPPWRDRKLFTMESQLEILAPGQLGICNQGRCLRLPAPCAAARQLQAWETAFAGLHGADLPALAASARCLCRLAPPRFQSCLQPAC